MDIKTFKHIAPLLPPDQAILMKGPTGIGKSAMGKDVATTLALPLIDVRTAVMQEGDMVGIPDLEGIKETGVVSNAMYGWFVRACREPVVLFLDEINRAMVPVLNGAFQLVLDRTMGNDANGEPYRLHPETRVLAAGNFGAEYESEDLDPAMQRRFLVVDLAPTNEDWLTWAKDNVDEAIVEFIRTHPVHLRVDPSSAEPGSILPNPATWDRVSKCLTHAGMAPLSWAGNEAPMGAYSIAMGLVGPEAAIAMIDFVKNYEQNVSAEDVIERWKDVESKVADMAADRRFALIDGIVEWLGDNDLNVSSARNVGLFAEVISGEELVSLWTKASASGNINNIKLLHSQIGKKVVEVVQKARHA